MERAVLTRDELAAYVGVSIRTLERLHDEGKGPPRRVIGRRVIYLRDEVDKWLLRLPKESSEKKPEPSGASGVVTAAEVQEVWDRHLQARERFFVRRNGRAPQMPSLTSKRKAAIRAAIKEHGLEKAKSAGVGIFLSDFHTGKNDEGRDYLDPDLCWRMRKDSDHVERFAGLYTEAQARFRRRAG